MGALVTGVDCAEDVERETQQQQQQQQQGQGIADVWRRGWRSRWR